MQILGGTSTAVGEKKKSGKSGEKSTQEEVFEEVSHLVQSALDGYKVCLFAYGQTGSGKTHTMLGGSGDAAGIIPRCWRWAGLGRRAG